METIVRWRKEIHLVLSGMSWEWILLGMAKRASKVIFLNAHIVIKYLQVTLHYDHLPYWRLEGQKWVANQVSQGYVTWPTSPTSHWCSEVWCYYSMVAYLHVDMSYNACPILCVNINIHWCSGMKPDCNGYLCSGSNICYIIPYILIRYYVVQCFGG